MIRQQVIWKEYFFLDATSNSIQQTKNALPTVLMDAASNSIQLTKNALATVIMDATSIASN